MSTMATDGIIYSPVSKMDIAAFNEKALHALKYHQLLKLSSKYNIKKRWAKKDDLVKSLLAVRDNALPNVETLDNTINEELEWTDGKEALKNMAPPRGNGKIARSTFTIEKIDLEDSRATFNVPKNTEVFLGLSNLDPRLTFDIPKKPVHIEKKTNSKVKMLTVPATRPAVRTAGNKSKMSVRESPLKMSNRSITIKKSKDAMSPMKTARSLLSDKKRMLQSPARVSKPKENQTPQPERRLSNRRKSKSDDPEVRRRSGLSKPSCSSTRTPPVNTKKGLHNPTELLTGVKPITVTKMPNFAAIHQKQFSKMDSLDEYINKKSERVKKLFGTPMSSRPNDKEQSQINTRKLENVKEEVTFQHKYPKTKLEEARNIVNRKHLQTRTEVKDRNRSHIHGIRTNRRFELQMKFRNI